MIIKTRKILRNHRFVRKELHLSYYGLAGWADSYKVALLTSRFTRNKKFFIGRQAERILKSMFPKFVVKI